MAKRDFPGNKPVKKPQVEKMPEVTKPIEPPVESLADKVYGTVVGCTRLNVRAKPNIDGMIKGALPVGSKVEIDESKSTNEWYRVTTDSGFEGYCMRKYVAVKS